MNAENLLMLEMTYESLAELRDQVVFVGAATVELWITDQAAPEFRRTEEREAVEEAELRAERCPGSATRPP